MGLNSPRGVEYRLTEKMSYAPVRSTHTLAQAAAAYAEMPGQCQAAVAEYQEAEGLCSTGVLEDDILMSMLDAMPLDMWMTPEDLDLMSGHVPVMLEECLDGLNAVGEKRYLDGTFGGGGHTQALLQLGAEVVAFDRDPAARERAEERLSDHLDALTLVHGNFADALEILGPEAEQSFDGILLDLGISSIQLDDPERGFSFQTEGPLDMRMDTSRGATAADLVNSLEARELTRLFREYGEEPQAVRVANAIVKARAAGRIETTEHLAEIVASVIPRTGKKHPATRVFQALRIAVNDELESLRRALPMLTKLLKPGGRLAIISFHSLEDRIVKHFLQETSREWNDRPEWPAPRPNPAFSYRLIGRKPVGPTEEEVERNPRSRSAKLRVAERVIRPQI
jgi:16S rRNA (cytosine1402-N4)-methyltransferase